MSKDKAPQVTPPAPDQSEITTKLAADLEALTAEVATLKEENAGLKKSLAELAAGTAKPADAPAKPTLPKNARFKVDGKTYEILAPVMDIPGIGRRSAEELLLDKAAQKKLVDRKAGVIKEVL